MSSDAVTQLTRHPILVRHVLGHLPKVKLRMSTEEGDSSWLKSTKETVINELWKFPEETHAAFPRCDFGRLNEAKTIGRRVAYLKSKDVVMVTTYTFIVITRTVPWTL